MSESSLFQITPERLIFNLDTDNISELSANTSKISKDIHIKIINVSTNSIAIKIKTTKKNNYIMSPSSEFVIPPKEEKEVNIRFKRDEGEKLKLKSHKVLFEGIEIKEEDKDLSVKELFDKYTKGENKVDVITRKIESEFFDKNGNNLSSLSNTLGKVSDISNTNIEINNVSNTNKNKDIHNNIDVHSNTDINNNNEINTYIDISNNNDVVKNNIEINNNIDINNNKDNNKNIKNDNITQINKGNDMNLIDLGKASDKNIIIALVLSLLIGLFILN